MKSLTIVIAIVVMYTFMLVASRQAPIQQEQSVPCDSILTPLFMLPDSVVLPDSAP